MVVCKFSLHFANYLPIPDSPFPLLKGKGALCPLFPPPPPPAPNFPTKLNPLFCSSGSRTGGIHHHDVRVATHHVATLANHTQEVCGLRWSPDGQYLASGGNDNAVNVWDSTLGMEVAPLHTFTEHQAAVKVKAAASLV